jgi:hypothetical protein
MRRHRPHLPDMEIRITRTAEAAPKRQPKAA